MWFVNVIIIKILCAHIPNANGWNKRERETKIEAAFWTKNFNRWANVCRSICLNSSTKKKTILQCIEMMFWFSNSLTQYCVVCDLFIGSLTYTLLIVRDDCVWMLLSFSSKKFVVCPPIYLANQQFHQNVNIVSC